MLTRGVNRWYTMWIPETRRFWNHVTCLCRSMLSRAVDGGPFAQPCLLCLAMLGHALTERTALVS
ncbi:hypothetical protein FHS27_005699 [Rhodopirellula rubra]|uniref:Uncharacterized protein n=1 Tax=Aporhodopirellula rubra TaxID=980271 RepID=A0A7W5E4Z8_9BACT|nr:hypothetical protein [Aporhodopirellula rubra]